LIMFYYNTLDLDKAYKKLNCFVLLDSLEGNDHESIIKLSIQGILAFSYNFLLLMYFVYSVSADLFIFMQAL